MNSRRALAGVVLTSSGRRTFTIAANAMAGTVVPYYSSTDASAMATPDGTITVAGSPAATTMLPSVPLPVVIHSETIGALPATTAP